MTKCIDTSVWIPYLVPETLQPQARNLIVPLLTSNERLVASAFAWAEVGSVLLSKVRLGAIMDNIDIGFHEVNSTYKLGDRPMPKS